MFSQKAEFVNKSDYGNKQLDNDSVINIVNNIWSLIKRNVASLTKVL